MLEFAWSNLPNNLIQIGLTVSAAALVLFVLRRVLKKQYPARAICFVWALLAIRLLVPVQFTLPDPPVQITPPERTLYVTYRWNADAADAVPSGTPQAEQVQAERPRGEWMTESEFENRAVNVNGPWMNAIHVDNVLVMVWLIGILYNALRQWRDYRRYLRQLNRPSADAQRDTLRRVFAEQKQSLGIRRDIPLVVTPAADCPMLAGFLKPTLYLPDEALSEQEAMFIFRHELTHYKRGDLWLKLLLTAAKTVHWFNPLVYLMARFAQEDIELACDDAVVRGMDGAQRRAYGETILRSAVAQVKKRALVSCFTGDKETLMRRFEGLFDKRAKKRGVALVVAAAVLVGTLGCAVSVGESKNELTEELRLQLAQEWLQRPEYETTNATVKLDGDDTYILYDHYNKVVWEGEIVQSLPLRTGAKLSFEKDGDGWQVSGSELIAESGVASLDEFRILYENDLGFPDFLGRIAQSDWDTSMMDISTPDKAAVNLLYLRGNISVREGIQEDICDVSITFADGSEVTITMVNQFGEGWLPQDFTYPSQPHVRNAGWEDAINNRTAADLAQQYARGVLHKSGQYIYPILSAQKQQDFIAQQGMGENGGINWEYGTSSPSYRDFALVPTSGGEYIVVFQMYAGGVDDYREAYLVETGRADGRSVILDVRQVERGGNMTDSEIFRLYYDSGLAWPVVPEGADRFNDQPLDTLNTPDYAAAVAFSYIGGISAFAPISESGNEAVVRLHFADGSPSVDVRMERTDGYWMPVGIASQFDDGFGATAESGGETVALPAGQDIAGAVNAAETAGGIPQLQNGDAVALRFGAQPAGDVTLTERDINIDSGTPRYDARLDVETTLPHSADGVYTYTVEPSMGQYLSSQYPDMFYRAVTVDYTDESGTARTATFVFCTISGDAQPDYTITSTTYHNDTYGYTLTLPECFVDRGYLQEIEETVKFGMKNAWPSEFTDPFVGGTVMTLCIEATDSLEAQYGADWVQNYPLPCKELTERDGMTYYLEFASDVQYDPQDETIKTAYTEMYQAAEAMDGSSITIDEPDEAQRQARMKEWLCDMADTEGYTRYTIGGADRAIFYWDCTIEVDGNTATAVFALRAGAGRHCRAVEILEASDEGGYHLTRQDWIMDENTPTDSLERFLLRFDNGLALPEWQEDEVRALMEAGPAALRDPIQAAEWTLDLSGGTVDNRRTNGEQGEEIFRYTWADGSQVTLVMKTVQLGDAAQPIYLPIRWDAETAGGSGWEYDPYTYMMCRDNSDFSSCTAEELAYYLTLSDGAYTENILYELDLRWQDDPEGVDWLMEAQEASISSLWESHKAANPDIFGARFSEDEIEAAYQAVRDYAAENGFSVENLRYDTVTDWSQSQVILRNGVLQDNVQQDGLTIDDVITVVGDAQFGENAWRESADGWSFTLYRGADGRWVLEDGAYGY
ncbi:M56 family metallopeptidase [Agathobaculum sp.]|uniref:M56 family metallopeptidase n=1 Tax=Agathobaculum sp. TaxID=2048138 RepID=UPI0039A39709